MRLPILEAVLASYFVVSSLADTTDDDDCATEPPPLELVKHHANLAMNGSTTKDHAPIVVTTYFHVVTTDSKRDRYTQSMMNDQLSVMNDIYGAFGITFELAEVDFTVNEQWARSKGDYVESMKPALRKGNYRDLNLYFLSNFAQGTKKIGVCKHPVSLKRPGSHGLEMDGCQIHAETIPGVPDPKYPNVTEGKNAVHEVGHWFGLLHVFQDNNCTADGDHIADTPVQRTSSGRADCKSNKNSCPNQPGLDSIHNYMDYGSDACRNEFTPGQQKRMFQLWDTYRAGK